jgi:hypothetical protein
MTMKPFSLRYKFATVPLRRYIVGASGESHPRVSRDTTPESRFALQSRVTRKQARMVPSRITPELLDNILQDTLNALFAELCSCDWYLREREVGQSLCVWVDHPSHSTCIPSLTPQN